MLRMLFIMVALLACGAPVRDLSSTPLRSSTFEEMGLDRSPWDSAIDEIVSSELPVDSLMLTVEGQVVASHHGPGHDRSTLHDLRSSTKSITSILVGIAIDRGLIPSVDAEVAPFFPEQSLPPSWASYRALTIADLLTMRSGLDCNDWGSSRGHEDRMYLTPDWLRFFFSIPALESPGERFSYCTAGVVVLGEIVSRAAGQPLPEVARAWLWEPLGIREAHFAEAPMGVTDAGGHLEISAESLTKVALLAMNQGRYEGRQIVSEAYVRDMLSVQSFIAPEGAPGPRYGYLFWLEPVVDGVVRSFQTRGNGGQYAIALPELRAVVTFTGHAYNDGEAQRAFFRLTSTWLIPMLETRSR